MVHEEDAGFNETLCDAHVSVAPESTSMETKAQVVTHLSTDVDASAAVSPLQSEAHPMVRAHFEDRTSQSLTVRSVPPVKRRRQSEASRRPNT